MSDLQIAPERGKTPLVAILIALLVLGLTGLAVFYLNPRRTAELTVKDVKTFAPQTAFKDLGPSGKSVHVLDEPASSSESNLYVVTEISLADKLRLPLFISGWNATVTLQDGSVQEATSIPARDLERLTDILPHLASMIKEPLHDGDEVAPSTVRNGSVVVLFPGLTREAWQNKKLARLTIHLRNQEPQVVALP